MKGTQIGKEEITLSLFTDDIITYVRKSKRTDHRLDPAPSSLCQMRGERRLRKEESRFGAPPPNGLVVAKPGECSPGCPEQACSAHLEAQGLVRSQSFGEAHPPAVLPPGLLSRLPHQPFLVSSVTQFMRLTQGFAVLVELQGAGSELAPHHMAGFTRTKPGPPCLSWVGVKPRYRPARFSLSPIRARQGQRMKPQAGRRERKGLTTAAGLGGTTKGCSGAEGFRVWQLEHPGRPLLFISGQACTPTPCSS